MKKSLKLKKTWIAASALTIASMLSIPLAHSETWADAAYNGWLKAYMVKSGDQTYFVDTLTQRDMAFMWGQAYIIEGVEDAYQVNFAADRRQLITDALDTFIKKNGTDLSWDGWNDDIAWATISLMRGYQISGNKIYLETAKKNWDMAYARGWDSDYGGGIWENMDNIPNGGKCALSNWPFVISGAMIYLATGDVQYLNKSKEIYAWTRTYLFDLNNGRVHEQIGPSGIIGDDNVYNSGMIVNAANALYKITGNTQYYNDALLATEHVINRYPIMTQDKPANGGFGSEQFYRGLGNFARQNNLWPKYAQWFANNADAAWKNRRTDYNFTHNDLSKPTPMSDLRTMEVEGSIILHSSIQTSVDAGPFNGTYQIQNVGNGLSLSVYGASTSNGGQIVQVSSAGEKSSLWTFESAGGGYYHIKNANSGLVLNVSAASGINGAKIIQWSGQGAAPGNDHWRPVKNPDGTFYFINMYSGQALDVPGGSSATGLQLNQWFTNSTTSQKFKLIPQNISFTKQIEAESFTSKSDVGAEATTDSGGGQNVGWIDANDWMAYANINFPVSGNYKVEYRVASPTGSTLSLDLNTGSIQLGQVNIPATGGWQNWVTVENTVNINAGTYSLRLFAQKGGWNVNWIKFTKL